MYDFPACVRCLPLVQSAMNKKVERWAGLCGNQSCPFQGLWRGNQYFSYTVSWNRKTVRISRQVKRAGYKLYRRQTLSFPGGSVVSACQAGDVGSIPGLGRSPGEGNDNLLQYSCLENPMDQGVWQAAVHRGAKTCIWLSTHPRGGIPETMSVPEPGSCSWTGLLSLDVIRPGAWDFFHSAPSLPPGSPSWSCQLCIEA